MSYDQPIYLTANDVVYVNQQVLSEQQQVASEYKDFIMDKIVEGYVDATQDPKKLVAFNLPEYKKYCVWYDGEHQKYGMFSLIKQEDCKHLSGCDNDSEKRLARNCETIQQQFNKYGQLYFTEEGKIIQVIN